MTTFNLTTTWKIPASIEACWFSILDVEAWPGWWKYVDKVAKLKSGDITGVNNVHKYSWSTLLPYHIVFELQVTRLVPYKLISFDAKGDLGGSGCCQFKQKDQYIQILFDWNVKTNKPWMNFFASITHPVFEWNHRQVMRAGEQSLIQKLDLRQ